MSNSENDSVVILESDGDDSDDVILVDACGVADTSQQDVIFVKRSRRHPQPGDSSRARPNEDPSPDQPATANGLPESERQTIDVTVDETAINYDCIKSPDASPACLKSIHDDLDSPDQPGAANGLPESEPERKTVDVTVDEIAINSDGSMSPEASPSSRKRVCDDFDGEDQLSACKITYEVFRPASSAQSSIKRECTCHLTKDMCDSCVVRLECLKPKQEDAIKLECTCNVTRGLCDNCIVHLERCKAEPVSLVRKVEGGAFPLKRFRLDESNFPQPCSSRTLDLNEYRCQNVCFACGTLMVVEDLSQCLNAHRCCSECLQKQAKTLLTRQTSKGSLHCLYPECEAFYPLSELRKALPPMVIDIVEEKLEQENIENAAKGMLGDASGGSHASNVAAPGQNGDAWVVPFDWEPMDSSGEMKTVSLDKGSDAYAKLLLMFHRTMLVSRANVLGIQRVQNPALWQYYSVKKKQMLLTNGADGLLETYLFHGTSKKLVAAICKNNFDWRLCGSHGTAYGQGSYFARDACYAHRFTVEARADPLRYQLHRSLRMIYGNAALYSRSTVARAASNPTGCILPQPPPTTSDITPLNLSSTAPNDTTFLQSTTNNPTSTTRPLYQSSSSAATCDTIVIPRSLPRPWATRVPQPLATTSVATLPRAATNEAVETTHTMFIARVLVGRYTHGYKQLRKPPPLNANDRYGASYDSCTNDVVDPNIFVIFDNTQCYPEYVIKYTNAPRWKPPSL